MANHMSGTIIDDYNYRSPTDPPEIKNIHLVKNLLRNFFEDKADQFNTILKESGALVSGGAILSAITGARVNDIDIYVPISNLKSFIDKLQTIFIVSKYKVLESSKYCRSFLRRNGIKKVYTVSGINNEFLDIMSIRNNRTPLQVVNNFDLTFCQTWFDGEHIYASHPDHIKNRSGVLQGEYVPLFVAGNRFLRNRVDKYTKYRRPQQTFKITLDTTVLDSLVFDNKTTSRICGRYEIDYNIWFVSKLMKFILTNTYSISDHDYKIHTNTYYHNKYTPIDITKQDEYDSENEEVGGPNMLKLIEDNYLVDSGLDVPTRFAHAKHNFFYEFNKLILSLDDSIIRHFDKFNKYIMETVKREGECFILKTDEVVWDFHKHTLEQGISQEGLEAYLTSIMSDPDKKNIKCYIGECDETLKEYEVRPLVDKEFWERFTLPTDISPKINTSTMDMILTNTKSTTNGWGNIYHHTICPFCIAQEVREEGCAYMTHKVTTKLRSPFCEKYNVIKEIVDKYAVVSPDIKLQFCITCGRPSGNHKHFDLNLDAPKLITTVIVQGEDAYTKCMGGGRPELFARLLAIQKVILEQEFDDATEQRKACAFAALKAPLDPELMARGQAIFDKDPEGRTLANLGVPQLSNEQLADIEFENSNEEEENNQGGGGDDNKNIVSLSDLKMLYKINKTRKSKRKQKVQ